MTLTKKHTGGRVITPNLIIINFLGDNPYFSREIWVAHGSPPNLALGDGWTSIDDFTFMDTNLKKIKLPTSITYIGNSAFENAQDLESVIFNPDSQLKTIGEGAFKNAKALTTIEIPSGIETIPFHAFEHASNLKSIKFDMEHSQLKTIEAGAFNYTDLYSLYLPKSIQRVSQYTFFGNINLTEIHMYPSVLERLNADDLTTQARFGMNSFDDNNMFFGIDHPVNIIPIHNTRGGRRKIRSRTRKSSTRRRRRTIQHKSKRRRTMKLQ